MKINRFASKITLYVFLLIPWLLIGQTSNAQYIKAIKGDRVPYDTAVITDIHTYRTENKKMKAADGLLKGYDTEITSLYRELASKDSLITANALVLMSKDRLIDSKTKTISEMQYRLQQLIKMAVPARRTWWDKNKLWVGIVAGGAASYYIYTNIK